MQVFEFLFNPKIKDNLVFDSFCYDPQNIYEKRMGSLYMAGSLKNVLPQNLYFLNNLAKAIRERYYKTISATPEKSLKETLRKVNDYLEKVAKSGDVSWLGNLNFTVLSLKNYELNFTKVGDLKIYLIRKGQIIDIDQKLKFEEIEPYPLKIFGNIVSGTLNEDDVILIATKEISDFFIQDNLMNEFSKISLSISDCPEKRNLSAVKKVFENKKERLGLISGVCLFVGLSKESLPKEKEIVAAGKKKLNFAKNVASFLKPPAMPKTIATIKKPVFSFTLLEKIKRIRIYLNLIFLNITRLLFTSIRLISNLRGKCKKSSRLNFNTFLTKNKNWCLVLLFIIVLFIGSLITNLTD
ncbi:MAG: hypothetical protein PHW72_01340 [Candidatus Pacebacteria bacterium]|nr:hypothetical protein [Candidatus Paceibacterota bacterium]